MPSLDYGVITPSILRVSITVNDSLDCSHRAYGHGARKKKKQYDVLAEILRKEKFPVNFFAT